MSKTEQHDKMDDQLQHKFVTHIGIHYSWAMIEDQKRDPEDMRMQQEVANIKKTKESFLTSEIIMKSQTCQKTSCSIQILINMAI